MYEVELKVRADHDRLRAALTELDAERLGRVRQVDTYYGAPYRDFAETDEALRIRREESLDDGEVTSKFTYKGPLVEAESKTREEHETAVDDETALEGILDGLDFEPVATVEKDREFVRVGEYTVTLDDVADLGTFCEIEVESATADIEALREGAVDVLADLGLDADEQIRTSYLGMLLESEERRENN